jgi:hypothetical protein
MPKPKSEFDPEPHLSFLPAAPGYRVIHAVESFLSIGEDIIGWRIRTHWDQGEHISDIDPVLTQRVCSNAAGILHPDGSASCLGRQFATMEQAQRAYSIVFND